MARERNEAMPMTSLASMVARREEKVCVLPVYFCTEVSWSEKEGREP